MIPKFRAWDKKNKMFTNYQIVDDMKYFMDKYTGVWLRDEDETRFTLMQSTGLKDKNGVEIFKGDILEEENTNVKLKLIYCECCCQWLLIDKDNSVYQFYRFDWSQSEVIGNIYENPKLLED